MYRFLSIGLVVTAVFLASAGDAGARGCRFRRYYYSYRPAPAAKVLSPAAPAASTQANRQAVRRYSYVPNAPSYGAARTYRAAPTYLAAPAMRGTYGPQFWRADRKVLGY
ncbi:MAG TPA: hypothetical protein VMV69_18270 [Pirellulales bacterium]|nr:hypothetical protein [Pirellulales bacterium]